MLDLSFDPFPVLSTQRMLLRAVVPSDRDALFALRSDPRVMRHIARPIAKTLDDASKLMDVFRESLETKIGIVWAMTLHGDAKLIGTVGLWRIVAEHHRAELGYLLAPSLWGRGLTQEASSAVVEHAFEKFRFHRLEACIAPENAASIRVAERLGFKREAHFTQNFHFEGAFLDTLVYGLVRSSPARA